MHKAPLVQKVTHTVRGEDTRKLDKLVQAVAGVSRRVARTLIATGQVRVDGRAIRIVSRELKAGAALEIDLGQAASHEPAPSEIGVLYADRYMIVVDKPAQLLSEHDRFGSPSLESRVPALLRERGERDERVWLVHRLDAGTSGVIVLARTPMAVAALNDAFRESRVEKRYLALVKGRLDESRVVDAPIGKAERTKHRVDAGGKPAQTHVEPLASVADATLVLATPRTGRTHQIRVHLAHLGHPLFGDRLYGGPVYTSETPPEVIVRPMLHALSLTVPHPKTGERRTFTTPPPADFRALAARFGLQDDALAPGAA